MLDDPGAFAKDPLAEAYDRLSAALYEWNVGDPWDHVGEAGTVDEAAAAVTGRRAVHFGEGLVDAPVVDGTRLAVGATVVGPALVEEPFTVVVVPPGSTCTLGEHLAYELVRD